MVAKYGEARRSSLFHTYLPKERCLSVVEQAGQQICVIESTPSSSECPKSSFFLSFFLILNFKVKTR